MAAISAVDILILGGGVSGLLMALRLTLEGYAGRFLLVDAKPGLTGEVDDVPYYFNRVIQIPGLALTQAQITLQAWQDGNIYPIATEEMVANYAIKIVGRPCPSTISNLGQRTIYVPEDPTIGRRRALLESLLNSVVHRVDLLMGIPVKRIGAGDHEVVLATGEVIRYRYLVSTIPLSSLQALTGSSFGLDLSRWPIHVTIASLPPCGYYEATYCPDPEVRINRVAVLNNAAFIEAPVPFDLANLTEAESLMLKSVASPWIERATSLTRRVLVPGRFIAITQENRDEVKRRLEMDCIFLLGRYATWTFMLTEDVWDDTDLIAKRYELHR